MEVWDVVVVGAGVTGLTLAHQLQNRGHSVLLLDKGSRPGGRLASRPFNGQLVNPAAESVLVRDPEVSAEISRRTGAEFLAATAAAAPGAETQWEFNAPAGEIAKRWAVGTEQRKCFVTRLDVLPTGLIHVVAQASGEAIAARTVVLTAPVPQSIHILQNSELTVSPELNTVSYDRRAVLLCTVDGFLPGSAEPLAAGPLDTAVLDWVRVRHQDDSGRSWLEVFATTAWSEATWNDDLNLSQMTLLAGLHRLHPEAHVLDSELKRWRYANAVTTAETAWHQVPGTAQVYLAGDGFSGARSHASGVSRAVRSGLDLAAELATVLAATPA
jgi:predicted NAD/FAD-dependent oxidoreductase